MPARTPAAVRAAPSPKLGLRLRVLLEPREALGGDLRDQQARHLGSDRVVLQRTGQDWVVDAHAWAPAAVLVVPVCATVPAHVWLPIGLLGLDPGVGVTLGWYAIQPPGGLATTVVPIPNVPGLLGTWLYCQAAVLDPQWRLRLTSATAEPLVVWSGT